MLLTLSRWFRLSKSQMSGGSLDRDREGTAYLRRSESLPVGFRTVWNRFEVLREKKSGGGHASGEVDCGIAANSVPDSER